MSTNLNKIGNDEFVFAIFTFNKIYSALSLYSLMVVQQEVHKIPAMFLRDLVSQDESTTAHGALGRLQEINRCINNRTESGMAPVES
jgi:hypothetical protein